MKDRIKISVEQGVADVRLVRSDKMNALDPRMFVMPPRAPGCL